LNYAALGLAFITEETVNGAIYTKTPYWGGILTESFWALNVWNEEVQE
jgi:hypothetical protein